MPVTGLSTGGAVQGAPLGDRGPSLDLRPGSDGRVASGMTTEVVAHHGAPNNAALRLPIYLQLVRAGNVITASLSQDAKAWKAIGTQTYKSLPQEILAGIAVWSGWNRQSMSTTALFDQLP